jgi:xylulokinase
MPTHDCVIALDLGTTAFKCAPVDSTGLLAEPVTVSYDLHYGAGSVTLDPEIYVRVAREALTQTAQRARQAGLTVRGIGISSQAQTYIPLNNSGQVMQKAVVWTDTRAVDEAAEVEQLINDFPHHSGFIRPLPALFMPKIKHLSRHSSIALSNVWKFALLNEYIIYRLTGHVYGDETNQGMSGFYNIAERCWSSVALQYAGIRADQLADVAAGARLSHTITSEWQQVLNLSDLPVYSCGNDQSCSAAGAGLREQGDILCNFGTAMIVYALRDVLPATLQEKQIAGINPYTGRYFLLALENECGNVLDWAHSTFYSETSFSTMMDDALCAEVDTHDLPKFALPGSGRIVLNDLTIGHERRQVVRGLLEYFADAFGALYASVREKGVTGRIYVSGGLSRSSAWLEFISRKFSLELVRTTTEQPGLVGVARIIEKAIGG